VPLPVELVEELKALCARLQGEGKLHSRDRLLGYYATFRERFGPEQLQRLDGESLLDKMHNHGNRESLVYWLEFKDDEEFPAIFGSIAGGSALKFGIYRRKETGEWMTGSSKAQQTIPVEQAVQYARKHRDQLIAGTKLLAELSKTGSVEDYGRLQEEMDRVAPDVSKLAWGHKYFTLLFPDILDDFHSPDYQRFHLIKILQVPPATEGRYVSAGLFVESARQLDVPMNWFTSILNHRNGRPHRYWRIGTSDGTQPRNRWDLMRDNDCMAVGWGRLGCSG
jgi:5-methylcytosine-specific restriction protein B